MAKPKRGSASDPTNGSAETRPDTQVMFEANGAALAATMQASEAMLQGMAEINREMMNFATDRLRKGFETSESLMGCHDPAQAFGVQCDYARGATQAYLEEATRLMGLAAKVSDQCLESIEVQARENLARTAEAAARPTTPGTTITGTPPTGAK